MIKTIFDSSFTKNKSIGHAYFTRHGGVSAGIYSSLNCAYPSNDDPTNVKENRRRAMASFGFSLDSLLTVRNTHSANVVIAEKPWHEDEKPVADGIVTCLPNIVLGSDSADCPIVLLAEEKAGVIGLAHAGWRGAVEGILESTIQQMNVLGAQTKNIVASISPCILQDSYEVDSPFHQLFMNNNKNNVTYFKPSVKPYHFYFNLLGYVKDKLLTAGLQKVSTEAAVDTYSDDRFFSCRRATHQKEPYFGGHLSCIYKKA